MPHIRAAAERMAINAPIQGTQADIVKIAMVRVHAYLAEKKLLDSVRLVLQVHDELVYEISKERADESTKEIERIMEGVLTKEETHGVPLSVDVQVGKNWGEMKKT
jgi:DNA polymerase-1